MDIVKDKRGLINLFLFIGILLIFPISSCVYDKEFSYMNDQIVSLNRRVTKLQESLDTRLGSDLDSKLNSIHSSQAQMRVEIDQLKGKVGDLSGRTEESEHILKRTVERDLGEQDTMQASLVKLTQQVSELEAMVRHQSNYLGLEPSKDKEDLKKETGPGVQAGTGPEQPALKADEESKELDMYDSSLGLFKQEKYNDAMAGFQDFLKRYPKSDRADNAQFWIGECHMALKEYEQAVLAYQKVIKNYPKGNKIPNALLRQAIAFLELNDKTSTKLLLKKIVKDYPNSTEAKIAKIRLDALK
ncbi:MAG: tol-pal system protein YbgF [Pseudomonadota bacterium]